MLQLGSRQQRPSPTAMLASGNMKYYVQLATVGNDRKEQNRIIFGTVQPVIGATDIGKGIPLDKAFCLLFRQDAIMN